MKKVLWFVFGLIIVVFIILLVFLFNKPAVDSIDPWLQNYSDSCKIDDDCIPLPSDCHPRYCINKQYENMYEKPDGCTKLFDYQAAYSPEDCACQENICVNKNLDRNSLEE